MDINTKQRPVPNELLLDIKKLADAETEAESLLGDIFDLFDKRTASPLLGLTSPAERKRGKISRVTFNAALKPVFSTLQGSDAKHAYGVLAAYLHSWLAALRARKVESRITNPTLFRAIMALFPQIAERVSDRYEREYTVENFSEIVEPFVSRIKKADLQNPGTSYITLYDKFRVSLRRGFSISSGGR